MEYNSKYNLIVLSIKLFIFLQHIVEYTYFNVFIQLKILINELKV